MKMRVLLALALASLPWLTTADATAQGPVSGKDVSASPQTSIARDTLKQPGYGNLPLHFEANQGQTGPEVRYLAHGQGYSLYLTDQAAVLELISPLAVDKKTAALKNDTVRMELAGASPAVQVSGSERLPGKTNYLIGKDPARWHTNVPTFAQVKYSQVFPGVDLVYYGNQRQLEYDFVIAPGADPRPVRLHFAGASKLRQSADGDLEVIAKGGKIIFHKPVFYQWEAGERRPVEGRFALLARNTVGFQIGDYDHTQELIIDPTLVYSTYLGGGAGFSDGQPQVVGSVGPVLALDKSGNAYVTGNAKLAGYPTTPGAFQTTPKSADAIFVTKLNSSGTGILYSTFLSGSGGRNDDGVLAGDTSNGIAVDAEGNAYIVGTTSSADFPVTSGVYQPTFMEYGSVGGANDGFITKLNPSGSGLIWSTYFGGVGSPHPGAIAVDSSGNVYVGGFAASAYPTTPGSFQPVSGSGNFLNNFNPNPFVTKLNSSGSALVYSTFLGGNQIDRAFAIVVDASGCVYVAGNTTSTDFPVTPYAYQQVKLGGDNGGASFFVSKLNAAGNGLIYSTYLSGSGDSDTDVFTPVALAIDGYGNAYIAGIGSVPVTPGAFQTSGSAFVSKLSPTGRSLVYSTYLGGTTPGSYEGLETDIYGIAVDQVGRAYVTGTTVTTNFPVTGDAYQKTNNAKDVANNAFFSVFTISGSALAYSTYLGGSGGMPNAIGDIGYAIALEDTGTAVLYGGASSSNFPVSPGAYRTTSLPNDRSLEDSFVTEFTAIDVLPPKSATTLTASANPQTAGSPITFTASVAPASGTGTPTGTVKFMVNNISAAEVALDDAGHASYTASSLPVGDNNTVMATYLGGPGSYAASNYTVTEVVTGEVAAPTFLPLGGTYIHPPVVQLETATAGAAIYYTTDGSQPNPATSTIYTAPFTVSGSATTVKAIAVESGDTQSALATAVYRVVPTAIRTTTALQSSANPSTLGKKITLTAMVTAASGAVPTGSVVFKTGGSVLGTVSLSGGVASISTTSLAEGQNGITATYTGNTTDETSSQSLSQQVSK